MSDELEKNASEADGRQLHREFVGMLFALAIAEVAVEGSKVVHSDVALPNTLPSYTHLFLAAAVIATSWVGWGRSAVGLSNTRHVFTTDFLELGIDVWLVIAYFFIVTGVEVPQTIHGDSYIIPSVSAESFWVMVVFVTYFIWDILSKGLLRNRAGQLLLVQRGWASATCAVLAVVSYALAPRNSFEIMPVVVADVSLLSLVFLFRAMKLEDVSNMHRKEWTWTVALALLWASSLVFVRLTWW